MMTETSEPIDDEAPHTPFDEEWDWDDEETEVVMADPTNNGKLTVFKSIGGITLADGNDEPLIALFFPSPGNVSQDYHRQRMLLACRASCMHATLTQMQHDLKVLMEFIPQLIENPSQFKHQFEKTIQSMQENVDFTIRAATYRTAAHSDPIMVNHMTANALLRESPRHTDWMGVLLPEGNEEDLPAIIKELMARSLPAEYRLLKTGGFHVRVSKSIAMQQYPKDENGNPYLPATPDSGFSIYPLNGEDMADDKYQNRQWQSVEPY